MRYLLLTYLFLVSVGGHAQLVDDFDSNTFPDSPLWTGDTPDFMVNEDGELQLDAPESGISVLFSEVNFADDTITIGLDFRLEFDPSGSNQLRIYYLLDSPDLATASGYYFEMGQTGSDDAIDFYRLDDGIETQIGSGSMGAVASEPAVRLLLTIYPSGLQIFSADYTGGGFLEEDVVINDSNYAISESNYFGLLCRYTTSRADLFYFDNIVVDLFAEDTTAPEAISAQVVGPTSVLVTFDEQIEESSAVDIANYSIAGRTTTAATLDPSSPTQVTVDFAEPFSASGSFDLTVSSIADIGGNVMIEPAIFSLNYARKPIAGDILINELLFAPLNGSEDFVEIYNTTDDFIDLAGASLGNSTKTDNQLKTILPNTVIEPKGYIVFTEEKALLAETYENTVAEVIIEQDIPDYNNSDGNVLLTDQNGETLDSYDYDEDHHNALLSDVKGVSLERISPILDSNTPDTWTSASAAVGFATPGTQNSASVPELVVEEQFEFVDKVFSPDGDGDRELMVLGYNLDKPGYVANIDIRDIGGFLIKSLKSNETLSASGLITWDGIDENGKIANIGMYIIVGEVFHLDGDVVPLKKVCVLAGNL